MTPRRRLEEPHTHTCVLCGEYVIEAIFRHFSRANSSQTRLILDANPEKDGAYVAFLSGTEWIAREHIPGAPFTGSRRHEHDCQRRERQLELGLEEPS